MAKDEMKPDSAKEKKKRGWRDIVSERNPELNLDDDEAVAGWMEETFRNSDRMNTERQQLNELLSSNPQASGILTGLSSGMGEDGEPFSLIGYVLDNYWDEVADAAGKEEAIDKARKKEAEQIKQAAEQQKRMKGAEERLKMEDDYLTEAMESTNSDEAAVMSMLGWFFGDKDKEDGLIYRAIRHELTKEDFERLLYSFNRNKELESAKKDGMRESVRSRGGKPHRSFKDNAMPPDLGGGASTSIEEEDEDPTIQHYRNMGRRYQ